MDMMKTEGSSLNYLVVHGEPDESSLHYFSEILVEYSKVSRMIACYGYAKAREILRLTNHGFNFVVVVVNAPKTETFDFITCASAVHHLPIAVVSPDKRAESVSAAVERGCCGYYAPREFLGAAATMCQHVFHHRFWLPLPRHQSVASESGGEKLDDDDNQPSTSRPKKRRVVWTDQLHADFHHALNQLNSSDRVPKKILEIMKVKHPYLNRDNVASHLQKYREQMSRKQVGKKCQCSATFQNQNQNQNKISPIPNTIQNQTDTTQNPIPIQTQNETQNQISPSSVLHGFESSFLDNLLNHQPLNYYLTYSDPQNQSLF